MFVYLSPRTLGKGSNLTSIFNGVETTNQKTTLLSRKNNLKPMELIFAEAQLRCQFKLICVAERKWGFYVDN